MEYSSKISDNMSKFKRILGIDDLLLFLSHKLHFMSQLLFNKGDNINIFPEITVIKNIDKVVFFSKKYIIFTSQIIY